MLSRVDHRSASRKQLEHILHAKSGYPKSVLRTMTKQDMQNELKNREDNFSRMLQHYSRWLIWLREG